MDIKIQHTELKFKPHKMILKNLAEKKKKIETTDIQLS